jgi:hypothetical protein
MVALLCTILLVLGAAIGFVLGHSVAVHAYERLNMDDDDAPDPLSDSPQSGNDRQSGN